MKTYQSFLLISVDSVKRIDAREALTHLLIASSISRAAKRDWDLKNRTREMMTSFSGIQPFTGDTIYVKAHPILDGRWLLTVTVDQNRDAGTPSAATLPFSPTPPGRRASGMYKFSGASAYKEHTQNLYMSKRGRYYAPPLLPCRGQSGHPWPLDANQ